METTYLDIILKVLPVLLLILLGYMFKILDLFKNQEIEGLKKLIINVTLPCLLFLAFFNLSYEMEHLIIAITIFTICLLMLLIGKVMGSILGIFSPYFPLLLTGFEAGMVGYAIFTAVYGANQSSSFATVDLGQVIFVFFIMMTLLTSYKDRNGSLKKSLKAFLSSPVIWAILLGILFSSLGLKPFFQNKSLGLSLQETIRLLSLPTTPLICIVIGYELTIQTKNLMLPLKTIFIRLIFLIPIGLLANHFILEQWLHVDQLVQTSLMVLFILPPPFVIPLFINEDDNENKDYVVQTLSLHILVTLILYIAIITMYN